MHPNVIRESHCVETNADWRQLPQYGGAIYPVKSPPPCYDWKLNANHGFTLVENMAAMGIMLTFMASLFGLCGQSLRILKMARNQIAASQILQERNEQMRIANWGEMTDPNWLGLNILGKDANGTNILSNANETVWIVPFATGSNTIATTGTNVFMRANGNASSNNVANLSGNTAVQVTWRVAWTESGAGRSLSRAIITIIANGGTPK